MEQPVKSSRQELLLKEGLCTLIASLLLVLGAAFYPLAPVGGHEAGTDAAAPWLFLGLQELLRHLPPAVAGLWLPGAGLALLAALPWLVRKDGTRSLGAAFVAWCILGIAAALTLAGALRHF